MREFPRLPIRTLRAFLRVLVMPRLLWPLPFFHAVVGKVALWAQNGDPF